MAADTEALMPRPSAFTPSWELLTFVWVPPQRSSAA